MLAVRRELAVIFRHIVTYSPLGREPAFFGVRSSAGRRSARESIASRPPRRAAMRARNGKAFAVPDGLTSVDIGCLTEPRDTLHLLR